MRWSLATGDRAGTPHQHAWGVAVSPPLSAFLEEGGREWREGGLLIGDRGG